MSRKQEETSLTPAIWRKKQYFLIPSLIKGDARWLFLRVLCVYYWQAGWKMKGLVVMEICSRDAHGASEAMPHKSTYALHLPRRHETFPEFFSMAFHPPFVFFNWKLYEQWPEGSWLTVVSKKYINLARGHAQHARNSSILTYGLSAAIKRGNKNQSICLHE